jgi:hypothetical protein
VRVGKGGKDFGDNVGVRNSEEKKGNKLLCSMCCVRPFFISPASFSAHIWL